MASKLEQLKSMTTVVADTGDIEAIRRFAPQDATTNPSLLLKAAALPVYKERIDRLVQACRAENDTDTAFVSDCTQALSVDIGAEITRIVPGKVSTEVDARLSFNQAATEAQAQAIIDRYAAMDIGPERILIKIAATWEGIRAAANLEKQGIECNLTLLFGFGQAAACADAGVTLISPFVGRIYDWYKARGELPATPADDAGVKSVSRIYRYYKQHGYDTVVMGASFRNTDQIEQLAGCDRLTISPQLLEALEQDSGELPRVLTEDNARSDDPKQAPDEAAFRWQMNDDAMATEKLAEGIRAFAADQIKLETLLLQWPTA